MSKARMYIKSFFDTATFAFSHTPACCDFQGGTASVLFQSIQKVRSQPDNTQLYLCHNYPPETRQPQCVTTLA